MSWKEHTPHDNEALRQSAADPSSPKTESPSDVAPPPEDANEGTHHTVIIEAVHYYTIPNRESDGHYPQSGLTHDILKNPALYMDRADF